MTYDDNTKIFHGEVIVLKDIITFQGKSVDELKQAFQDSIYERPWLNMAIKKKIKV